MPRAPPRGHHCLRWLQPSHLHASPQRQASPHAHGALASASRVSWLGVGRAQPQPRLGVSFFMGSSFRAVGFVGLDLLTQTPARHYTGAAARRANASISAGSRWFVRREPDPSGGRAKRVVYTKRGLAALADAVEVKRTIEAEYQKKLGARRYEALVAALRALARE